MQERSNGSLFVELAVGGKSKRVDSALRPLRARLGSIFANANYLKKSCACVIVELTSVTYVTA